MFKPETNSLVSEDANANTLKKNKTKRVNERKESSIYFTFLNNLSWGYRTMDEETFLFMEIKPINKGLVEMEYPSFVILIKG